MLSTVISGSVKGIGGYLVSVEIDMAPGLPCIDMVGYLGSEVKEAKERVRVALRNIGVVLPPKRFTVNMSPAHIRKGGVGFDLAVAVGLMEVLGIIKSESIKESLFVGELGLDGNVRGIIGALPIIACAKNNGVKRCYLPIGNMSECHLVSDIELIGISNLNQLIEILQGKIKIEKDNYNFEEDNCNIEEQLLYHTIVSQEFAKRGALIAVAGFHNFLMVGPPGSGKTMMARSMKQLLPKMEKDEMLETSLVYSVSGQLNEIKTYVKERPFIYPHHSITPQGLIGGGTIPKPGMISLANHGILFLDELAEFKRITLDMLRQPLEDGFVTIARKNGSYSYPANCMLIAAMNPCPCGFYPDLNRCHCSKSEIHNYKKKISGPLLDRFDLTVAVERTEIKKISNHNSSIGEGIDVVEMIESAFAIQRERALSIDIGNDKIFNSRIPIEVLMKIGDYNKESIHTLNEIYETGNMSMRGYHKILRVARTIADLSKSESVKIEHVLEAVAFRGEII